MNIHNVILQFAFLYAPFVHQSVEKVEPNLYRGCDPTTKEVYALHDKGIKTIVSLRVHREKKKEKLCKELDMQWMHIPTGVFLTPTDQDFNQFRSIINNPENQPCYVCCEVGMDRVGVYIAAHRLVDEHWTIEQVKKEMKAHHKKVWWPVFRKYEKDLVRYANEHGGINTGNLMKKQSRQIAWTARGRT